MCKMLHLSFPHPAVCTEPSFLGNISSVGWGGRRGAQECTGRQQRCTRLEMLLE